MTDKLSCGHGREHLTEIDGQEVCHLCWLTDSGNYTYDRTPGTDALATAIERLADQVQNLAAKIAEQGGVLRENAATVQP